MAFISSTKEQYLCTYSLTSYKYGSNWVQYCHGSPCMKSSWPLQNRCTPPCPSSFLLAFLKTGFIIMMLTRAESSPSQKSTRWGPTSIFHICILRNLIWSLYIFASYGASVCPSLTHVASIWLEERCGRVVMGHIPLLIFPSGLAFATRTVLAVLGQMQ